MPEEGRLRDRLILLVMTPNRRVLHGLSIRNRITLTQRWAEKPGLAYDS